MNESHSEASLPTLFVRPGRYSGSRETRTNTRKQLADSRLSRRHFRAAAAVRPPCAALHRCTAAPVRLRRGARRSFGCADDFRRCLGAGACDDASLKLAHEQRLGLRGERHRQAHSQANKAAHRSEAVVAKKRNDKGQVCWGYILQARQRRLSHAERRSGAQLEVQWCTAALLCARARARAHTCSLGLYA